jgi:23S rRNA (guanosine2251-2'-O)-methyltransferase
VRSVFGIQPVREAIRAHGSRIECVLIEQGEHPQLAGLARFARDQGIKTEIVPQSDLDRKARGARHQGVMAIAPDLRLTPFEKLPLGDGALLLVLDGVQDPQNFGAVLRSSVALGADAVVWAEHASAPLSPATFRASAGAIEHATLCRVTSLTRTIQLAAERGLTVVGLEAGAPQALGEIDLKGPLAIVIGAEDKGLQKSVRRACTHLARITMRGPVGSLNASVAAALALYEVGRQRQ